MRNTEQLNKLVKLAKFYEQIKEYNLADETFNEIKTIFAQSYTANSGVQVTRPTNQFTFGTGPDGKQKAYDSATGKMYDVDAQGKPIIPQTQQAQQPTQQAAPQIIGRGTGAGGQQIGYDAQGRTYTFNAQGQPVPNNTNQSQTPGQPNTQQQAAGSQYAYGYENGKSFAYLKSDPSQRFQLDASGNPIVPQKQVEQPLNQLQQSQIYNNLIAQYAQEVENNLAPLPTSDEQAFKTTLTATYNDFATGYDSQLSKLGPSKAKFLAQMQRINVNALRERINTEKAFEKRQIEESKIPEELLPLYRSDPEAAIKIMKENELKARRSIMSQYPEGSPEWMKLAPPEDKAFYLQSQRNIKENEARNKKAEEQAIRAKKQEMFNSDVQAYQTLLQQKNKQGIIAPYEQAQLLENFKKLKPNARRIQYQQLQERVYVPDYEGIT